MSEVSKSDDIDNSGYIQPKDKWQGIDITFKAKYTGIPKLCLCKGSTSYFKIEETADAVCVRDIFDGSAADTTQEEDDNNKNIFVMNLNGYEICREQIPAVNAGMAYNIYPHKGINN